MIKNTNPRIKTLTKKLLMVGKKQSLTSIAISEFINGFNNHDNYYSTKSSLLRKGNYILSTTIKNNRPLVGVSNTLNNNYSTLLAPHEKFVSSKSETKEVLNPLEFEQWTREQVCSLLCMDDENGGANLDIKKVNPLYNVGFDGAYLGNLIKNSVFEFHKDFPEIPTTTIVAVENWVKDLLKTRLYQVWPVEKVSEILCVRAVCGGVGLSSSQAKPFIDAKVSGLELKKLYEQLKRSNELEKEHLMGILAECGISYTPQIETSCQMLIKWISSLQISHIPVFKKYEPQIKIEKLFTNEELLFLGKVEDLDLESLEKPKNADAFMFDLKNREECCTIVSSVVRRYYDNYTQETVTKQEVPFILATGGSGSGKSRIITELPKIIRNSHVEFKDTKLIYLNFTNGFNLENTERDNNYIAMITSRLVYSAFKYAEYVARSIPVSVGIHVLHELFYIISKKIHEKENVGMNVTIPIVLVLDEFQKATREIPSFGTNLKQALSWYITTLQKQHGLLIIPVFGGTLTSTDIEFLQTDNESSAVLLPLPCLREQDIDSIISDFPSVVPYYKDRFKLIWNVIGCVPRHLEWTINHPRMTGTENLSIPKESVMNEVYMDLSQQVMRLYSKLNFGMEEIAMICLSGLPMNRFETNQYLNYFLLVLAIKFLVWNRKVYYMDKTTNFNCH